MHRKGVSSATPLSAFLRVPLDWYASQTYCFFPDESNASIRRFYSHPSEQYALRQFCGYCGTPMSYWSEEPRSEADYIQLTLGSLLTRDLNDLEEMGILSSDSDGDEDEDDVEEMNVVPATPAAPAAMQLIGRELTSVPWFENIISGSRLGNRLGNLHTTRGSQQSQDGRTRVEWEITEWTADDDVEGDVADMEEEAEASPEVSNTGKRKRRETEHDGGPNTTKGNVP